MHASIATDARLDARPGDGSRAVSGPLDLLDRARPGLVAACLFVAALAVYLGSNPPHWDFYNHFVWQADAWLHGRYAIPYPVSGGAHPNDYFQDVMPLAGQPGYAVVPFPPLPAVLLLPFVAAWGLDTPASFLCAVLGACNVVLAWRLTRRLTSDIRVSLAATVFFAFGTVVWYASMLGSTWYLAHVAAMSATLLAVTFALDAWGSPSAPGAPDGPRPEAARRAGSLRTFASGLLIGTAALARLTTVFGAAFPVLVHGGSMRRRVAGVGLGLALPLAAFAAYNLATTGTLFNPAYEYVAQNEVRPVPELYHADWAIEDPRYVPQNLVLTLAEPPGIHPECGLRILDPACGTIRPDPIGMSLLLVSPGYLLAVPVLRRVWRDRLVGAAALAVAAIGLADLAHFSQGWVQFGFRFSNDFAPFALILVTLGIARRGVDRVTVGLIAASIAVNAWGVYWGVVLGW